MELTPLKKGFLPSSTPIQHSFADSGYFGSSDKSVSKKVTHTLSPIKEFTPLKKRLNEITNSSILKGPLEVLQLTPGGFIRELDFNNSSYFSNSNDDSFEDNYGVEKKSFRNFYYSCLLDPSTDNLFPAKQECVPLDRKKDVQNLSNELLKQLRPDFPNNVRPLSNVLHSGISYSAKTWKSNLKGKVDFVKELQKISCTLIVSTVLSYLSGEDLCRACCVNKQWKEVVLFDRKANKRRKEVLKLKRDQKENKGAHSLDDIPRWTVRQTGEEHKTLLLNISNILVSSQQPLEKHDTKFDSFLKEGSKVANGVLMKCPICNYASKSQVGVQYVCTKCNYSFCQKCSCPYVKSHKCSKSKVVGIIGSKQSKRNLKRL